MQRTRRLGFGIGLVLFLAIISPAAEVKNVIILITDGTSSAHITLSRWYKGSRLALDDMNLGGVRTYSSDSYVTDSAAGATSYACGVKTNNGYLGVLPAGVSMPDAGTVTEDSKTRPVANILEVGRLLGKSTGIVSTSHVQHATPAGFSSHWPDRENYNEIAEQQVYANLDVVLGGGKKYLLPQTAGGVREDGENLLNVIRGKGYNFIQTREELLAYTGGKVWGMFAEEGMVNDFDRPKIGVKEPALFEMVKKAIEILSKNDKGFVLFVEGSKVDWASHDNDPIGVVSEVLGFDAAVNVALEFAKKDKKTLVIAVPDHGNGGMALGRDDGDPSPATIGRMKKAKMTAEGVGVLIGKNSSEANIRKLVAENYGIDDLTPQEVKDIQAAKEGGIRGMADAMSRRIGVGWTTHHHTGEDLFYYTYGPAHPTGMLLNCNLTRFAVKGMGGDFEAASQCLFVPVQEVFKGYTFTLNQTDKANPVAVLKKDGVQIELPVSKNIVKVGTKTCEFRGLTILAPQTGKVYIPRSVCDVTK